MDDAWEQSDRGGRFIKWVKRLVHLNVDAAFVPAKSHLAYYMKMEFPQDRIIYGVDTVDNDNFAGMADKEGFGQASPHLGGVISGQMKQLT